MGKREVAIERGIPCPGPRTGSGPRTPLTRACHELKTGESMFCETLAERDTARKTINNLGGKVTVRTAVHEGKTGWRLWRLD